MMTYEQTLDYLYNVAPAFEKVGAGAYKEGLANTLDLDAHFGHPHRHYLTIHVAGTNGKGSTSHTLASMLMQAGLRVGLYTSPHLFDFNERIRVNGKPIPHDRVVRFVEEERSFFEPLQPSFFELVTALAFKYFEEQQVDIAVIEVGLGGRLDCTNIITPVLSVITNISLDHTQFLGNTLADIAREKAGIIKPGVPVVIGETTPETRPVFEQVARQQQAPIIFAEDTPQILSQAVQQGVVTYETANYGSISSPLTGACQHHNVNTLLHCLMPVARALKQHGHAFSPAMQFIRRGFMDVCSATGLMGRWQQLCAEPLVICDTGHNVGGWQYISQQIATVPCTHRHIVFGMVDDKDVETVMQMLPHDATYYFCQPSTHRAILAERLAQIGSRLELSGTAYPTVMQACHAALAAAAPSDFIFIGGSGYVVADLDLSVF